MPELTPDGLKAHREHCQEGMQHAIEGLSLPLPLEDLSDDELEIAAEFFRGVLAPRLEQNPNAVGLIQLRAAISNRIMHEQTRRAMVAEIQIGELHRMAQISL